MADNYKSTSKKFLAILTYIEENGQATQKELINKFGPNEEEVKMLLNTLLGKDNNHYIRVIGGDGSDHFFQITTKGIEYLNSQKLTDLNKAQTRYNHIIAMTGAVLAFMAVLDFFLKDGNVEKILMTSGKLSVWGIVLLMLMIVLLGALGGTVANFLINKEK